MGKCVQQFRIVPQYAGPFIASLVLVLVGMSACGFGPDSQIVGKWDGWFGVPGASIEFFKDGTCAQGVGAAQQGCRYSMIERDRLRIEYPPSAVVHLMRVAASGNELTLTPENGPPQRLRRAK